MNQLKHLLIVLLLSFFGCIKDDAIDEKKAELRITSVVDSIQINNTFQFESMYLNEDGRSTQVNTIWSSSNALVIAITESGLASGLTLGDVDIYADYGLLRDTVHVATSAKTTTTSVTKSGTLTSPPNEVEGSFTLTQEGDNLVLNLLADYEADPLPDLVLYLSNNYNSPQNAIKVSEVSILKGAHSYRIPNTGINDYKYVLYYCRQYSAYIGSGEIK